MKINKGVYGRVQSEPFDVQELKNGGKIELHSLNDNEDLYNEFAPKAKFALWTSQDGVNYRLLLEDGYYQVMHEIYQKRINQRWLEFWDNYDKGRKKVYLTLNLPALIIAVIAAILLMVFNKQLAASESGSTIQWIIMGVVIVGFFAVTFIANKKLDNLVTVENNAALEDIKNIVGHKHFDELMDEQQKYYDKFFGLDQQEENKEEEVESLEAKEEDKNEIKDEYQEDNNEGQE